jgi:hypothetical protein
MLEVDGLEVEKGGCKEGEEEGLALLVSGCLVQGLTGFWAKFQRCGEARITTKGGRVRLNRRPCGAPIAAHQQPFKGVIMGSHKKALQRPHEERREKYRRSKHAGSEVEVK